MKRKNKKIPYCAGSIRILMMKDKKEASEEWDKLVKFAYDD